MTVDEPRYLVIGRIGCEALVGCHHVPKREHPDHLRPPLAP